MDSVQLAKRAQMDLLTELDRICRKHDIQYFLVAGTLIGAIRHEGFIPWDDDIDVGFLRPDYERFREICREELDGDYFFHDWESDPGSPHPFGKLKIRGTHYPETLAAKADMNDSIYIDIFPYDNAPQSKFLRKKHYLENYLIRKILLLRCRFDLAGDSKLRKVLYGILNFLSKIRSVESWKKTLTRVQRRYNSSKTQDVTNLGGAYAYEKETMPREILETVIEHKFEEGMFYIPVGYDTFLRRCYGDYMQLPPVEQRVGRHEIVGIDFGDYQIRYQHTTGVSQ